MRVLGPQYSADFRDEQRQNREPVQRAVILRAEHTLLDVYGQLASPIAYANGAYIDIIHRIESQFKMYCMFRALTKVEGLLRIKITWDARYILGKQNVSFIFNFCDSTTPASTVCSSGSRTAVRV